MQADLFGLKKSNRLWLVQIPRQGPDCRTVCLGGPNHLPDGMWPPKVGQITREQDDISARQLRVDGFHGRGSHMDVAERHDFHADITLGRKGGAMLLDL